MEGKKKELLDALEAEMVGLWGESENDIADGDPFKEYPYIGQCYGPRDGCINQASPMWNDDVIQAIIELFYVFYKAPREFVEKELGIGSVGKGQDWIKIVVEPCYEDTSFIVAYLDRSLVVVFHASVKPWKFQFETPDEVADELFAAYTIMKTRTGRVKEGVMVRMDGEAL